MTANLISFVRELCDRIDREDAAIQAFLPEPGRRERLEREARELLDRYPDPAKYPPLFGTAAGVKDIFRVDGFETRAGSQLPPELFAGPESAAVTRLKLAGALVAGKTVTTEFAFFEPGPTRNPHNLEHTPGGSSSGSAAAVAAGLVPLALGTQTIGSINRPAAYCGVFGFKPSFGRIPTDGVIEFSRSADHVGFFTPDARGLARAAAVLCDDWRAGGPATGLPALGVPSGAYLAQTSKQGQAAFQASLLRLEKAGFRVTMVETLANIEELFQLHRKLVAAEIARVHRDWYPIHKALYRPRTAELIEQGKRVREEELEPLRANRAALREELQGLMARDRIDFWVTPAAQGPAPQGLASTGNPVMSMPWTHAGMPSVTVPTAERHDGLPLGIQLVGKFGGDEALISAVEKIAGIV